MNIVSKINPLLTLEYMQTENENKYFDRKSGRIRPVDLAQHISAFANADGGTLVIGISDKKRTLEGIGSCGDEKINEFINAPKDCCRPMPRYQEEFVEITNESRSTFVCEEHRKVQHELSNSVYPCRWP